jgi:hypothetical protein
VNERGALRIPERLLAQGGAELLERGLFPVAGGANESGFWNETLGPNSAMLADEGSVTPVTTMKAMWAPVNLGAAGALRANFWYPGRAVRLTAAVKLVVGATPGNIAFAMAYGSATAPDAPACIVSSTARAGIAATGLAILTGYAQCRTDGTAGTLSMWGMAHVDQASVAAASQPFIFPAAGVTVVSTIDTTVGTNALTFQTSYSGATPGTVVLVGLDLAVLN